MNVVAAEDPVERRRGLIALAAVQLAFGLFPVFGKEAFHAFAPGAVAAWRVAVGAAVLLGIAVARHGRRALPPRALLPRLAVCSLLGVALNQGLFLEGLSRTKAVNTGLVMCIIPVATYGFAVLLRQEAHDRRRSLGIVLAIAGTVPLLLEGEGAPLEGDSLGVALVIANALCYSLYLVLSKPLLGRLPTLVVIAWVYALSLPAAPWFARGRELAPSLEGNERAWGALAFVLVFPTVLAYLWNTYALKRVRASTVAFFVFLQPLVSGLGGVLVLGEELLPSTWITAAMLLVAMGLVVVRRQRS
ncbi:MAG: DMT family transporter [Planctomycetota bacterium JB042]